MTDYFAQLLFVGIPYATLTLLVVGTAHRFRNHNQGIRNLSTQFLDRRLHFWAVVPFHYGILGILLIHITAIVLPGVVVSWNSNTLRLYLLELIALALGLSALTGLGVSTYRRLLIPRVQSVTKRLDWIVFLLLFVQVISGILISILHPWGTSWLAAAGAPYIRSLFLLNPQVGFIEAVPWLIKLHLVNAFVLLGILPYTRLIHVLLAPVFYLWRSPILYRWKGTSKQ